MERMSASNAAKHIACPASANLELAIPGYQPPPNGGDTKASLKGTDIHEILERAAGYSAKEMLGISEAMRYVAQLRTTRRFKMLTEHEGEGWWLTQSPKPKTRADVVLYVADELHVIDYKFGRIKVEADDNDQGKYYSLAFLPLAPKCTGVTFHIVQPFADNIDSTFFTLDELEQFRLDTLAAEAKILAGDTTFNPSDACRFCPANPHSRGAKGSAFCPAMLDLYYPRKPIDEDTFLGLVQ